MMEFSDEVADGIVDDRNDDGFSDMSDVDDREDDGFSDVSDV